MLIKHAVERSAIATESNEDPEGVSHGYINPNNAMTSQLSSRCLILDSLRVKEMSSVRVSDEASLPRQDAGGFLPIHNNDSWIDFFLVLRSRLNQAFNSFIDAAGGVLGVKAQISLSAG